MALITVPTTSYYTHARNKCESSDGVTSITTNPDAENATEGVSLKNALFETEESIYTPTIDEITAEGFVQPKGYNWYFLRVNYGHAEQFYKDHKDKKDGYCLWMPCQKNVRYFDGRKIESLVPIFKSNLFIYATEKQAYSLTHRAPEGYPYIDFAYDHTEQNEFGRDHKMKIRFNEMLNFIRLEQIHHPWAHVVPSEKIHFREGGMVRVIDGSFKGVEGYVARVFGQTRVVVTIKGIVNYATAYVSQKYLQPIEEPDPNAPKKLEAGNSIAKRVIRHEIKVGSFIHKNDDKSRKRRRIKD